MGWKTYQQWGSWLSKLSRTPDQPLRFFKLTHCGTYFMFPVMRPIRLHKRPMIIVRLFCLTLAVALLANPVLAVVSASMDCDGACCCCTDTGGEPTATISSSTDRDSACCGPTGSVPCRMTAGSLPDAPVALIQATQRASSDTGTMLMSRSDASMSAQAHRLSISTRDTGATIPTLLLYLQSCRLIC